MKKAHMVWRQFLGAVAMGIAMLLVPVAASAHVPGDHQAVAAVDPAYAGCMHSGLAPVAGYRLHCHLSSLPSLADAAKQLRDRDQTAAPATAVPVLAARNFRAVFMPATHIPIAASPSYILFGNFRS